MAKAPARRKKRGLRKSRAQTVDQIHTGVRTVFPVQAGPVNYTAADLGLRKTKRGAKRGSSPTARRLERLERNVSDAADRVARASGRGTSRYVKARDRSARRRRDGALLDIYENVARGVSRAIAEASPATVDLAKGINSKGARRQMRSALDELDRLFNR